MIGFILSAWIIGASSVLGDVSHLGLSNRGYSYEQPSVPLSYPSYSAPSNDYIPPPTHHHPVQPVQPVQQEYLPPVHSAPAVQQEYLPPVQSAPVVQQEYLPPVQSAPVVQQEYLPPVSHHNHQTAVHNEYIPPAAPSPEYIPPPSNQYIPPPASSYYESSQSSNGGYQYNAPLKRFRF